MCKFGNIAHIDRFQKALSRWVWSLTSWSISQMLYLQKSYYAKSNARRLGIWKMHHQQGIDDMRGGRQQMCKFGNIAHIDSFWKALSCWERSLTSRSTSQMLYQQSSNQAKGNVRRWARIGIWWMHHQQSGEREVSKCANLKTLRI